MNNSKIEWTDHTFNPWWGCMKVSAGCKNCYAETLDNRLQGGHWGPDSKRRPMSDNYWKQPIKWNAAAVKAGIPAKVFCASMADVFEGRLDTLHSLRRLFDLIEQTPFLIWQLLTKHPENIMQLVPDSWKKKFPGNVWIGTSVENQGAADFRIVHLKAVPANVRFLSMEPLLEDVSLKLAEREWSAHIHWVIAGGESGHGARPMHPDWVRSIRDQCKDAGVSFFFKQWGEWADDGGYQVRVGKKMAGRLLDGKEYSQFPNNKQ